MIEFLLLAALVIVAIWLGARLFLIAPDHSGYDEPAWGLTGSRSEASPENQQVLEFLAEMNAHIRSMPRLQQTAEMRRMMDEGFLDMPTAAGELDATIDAVDVHGVPGEWVQAPGADPGRRLLYLHGGGFFVGSRVSHRLLTAALSRVCGASVLAIDYRLMPENRRLESVEDSQVAWRWMLENGPDGPGAPRETFVAGDSAGGNLALMLSAWARDEGLQLDGVIAFSPSTDSTLAGHSFKDNIDTDPLLGPTLGPFARLPLWLKALAAFLGSRISPRNPVVSPQFGDLSGLAPTLIQVSACEMLHDDGRRYVNKARSQGSPVTLETWPGMVHVFQMFLHVLPEANEALDNVARFVADPGKLASRSQRTD